MPASASGPDRGGAFSTVPDSAASGGAGPGAAATDLATPDRAGPVGPDPHDGHPATFLYDGDCAFCSATARLITRRVPTPARIVAWQFADIAALGLTAEQCDESVQWVAVDPRGARVAAAGPAAFGALLRTSTRGWRWLGHLLGTRPVLAAAGPVYRWIARHRSQLPGGTPTCSLPAARRPPRAVPPGP
jgi:predicted DCC family thiol-disulfide oxidoreductase YuxK